MTVLYELPQACYSNVQYAKPQWNYHLYLCFSAKSDDDLGLDSYLSKNTSEDNASFNEILHETQKKRELKHAWLYEQEQSRQEVRWGTLGKR